MRKCGSTGLPSIQTATQSRAPRAWHPSVARHTRHALLHAVLGRVRDQGSLETLASFSLSQATHQPQQHRGSSHHLILNTTRIKLCNTWQQLEEVVQVHGEGFNHINVAAALVQMAQQRSLPTQPSASSSSRQDAQAWDAYARYEALLQRLVQMVSQTAPQLEARQVANCMWAAAKLSSGYVRGHHMCLDLLRLLVDRQSLLLMPKFNSQELSMSIWAVAAAKFMPDDVWLESLLHNFETRVASAQPQHLATVAWAISNLGVAPDGKWVTVFCKRTLELLPSLQHRDAAQILASFARLGIKLDAHNSELVGRLGACLLLSKVPQPPGPPPQDEELPLPLAPHMPGLATDARDMLGSSKSRSAAVASQRRNHRASTPSAPVQRGAGAGSSDQGRWAVSVSQGLWGLVALGAHPPTAFLRQVMLAVHARLGEFEPRELSVLLRAFTDLGHPVPLHFMSGVFTSTLVSNRHSQVQLGRFDASSRLNQQQPGLESNQQCRLLHTFCPHSLSTMIDAISTASSFQSKISGMVSRPLQPPAHWMQAFLEAVEQQLPLFTDAGVGAVMMSLAALKVTPTASWATAVVSHLHSQQAGARPRALTNTLWALAKMGFRVNEAGLASLLQLLLVQLEPAPGDPHTAAESPPTASTSDSTPGLNHTASPPPSQQTLSHQEVSQVLYALARFKHQPAPALLQALLGQAQQAYQADTAVRSRPQASAPQGASQNPAPSSEGLQGVSPARFTPLRGPIVSQELANIIWSLAQLGANPGPQWLAAYWATCRVHLHAFSPMDMAQTVYGLGKLRLQPAAVYFAPAAGHSNADGGGHSMAASRGLPASRLQQPVLLASGAASEGDSHQQRGTAGVPHVLSIEPMVSAHETDPQELTSAPVVEGQIGSTLGAAEQGMVHPTTGVAWYEPLLAVSEGLLQRSDCSGLDVSNLVWGLAQLGVRTERSWCAAVAEAACTRGSSWTGGQLCTTLWALGRLGYRPKAGSLQLVEAMLSRRMSSLAPRELAACAQALSAMAYMPDVEWLETFADHCIMLADKFTQQDWAVTLCSMADLVDSNPHVEVNLDHLFCTPQLKAQVGGFTPQGVAMMAVACGNLGPSSQRTMNLVLASAESHLPAFSPNELAALITACAHMRTQAVDIKFLGGWLREVAIRLTAEEASLLPSPPSLHLPSTLSSNILPSSMMSSSSVSTPHALAHQARGFGVPPSRAAAAVSRSAGTVVATTPALSAASTESGVRDMELPATVLAVCGWGAARMGVRPPVKWLALYQRALCRRIYAFGIPSRTAVVLASRSVKQGRKGVDITPLLATRLRQQRAILHERQRVELQQGQQPVHFGPRELVMVLWALNSWEQPVETALLEGLGSLAKQLKPLMDVAERRAVTKAIKALSLLGKEQHRLARLQAKSELQALHKARADLPSGI